MAIKVKTSTKRASRAGKKVQFLQKPNCTTCRKARKFMERRGFQLYFRDLSENRLSVSELEKLIGKHDYTDFLNTRNAVYRKKKMKIKPPSRREAIHMMSKEPNLIRRPLIVAGGQVVIGFDKNGLARI